MYDYTCVILIFHHPVHIELSVYSLTYPSSTIGMPLSILYIVCKLYVHCMYIIICIIYYIYDIVLNIICLLFQLFKEKAVQIVDKLLPSFKTPSGIPKSLVNFKT